MTDMGSYTGGCHHSWGCENFKKDCNNCPAINSTNRAAQKFTIEKRTLKRCPTNNNC